MLGGGPPQFDCRTNLMLISQGLSSVSLAEDEGSPDESVESDEEKPARYLAFYLEPSSKLLLSYF